MKKSFCFIFVLLMVLTLLPAAAAEQTAFEPTAESLKKNPVPEWFRDAKFGIFIHWGIYSVPAYGDEWYGRHMYIPGSRHWAISQGYDTDKPLIYDHHKATYGNPTTFGYKDFLSLWEIDNYNPEEWAELFYEAGAKYVMPVGIHHDSFAMYNSDVTPWNAVNKGLGTKNHGPTVQNGKGRDLIGELQAAVKAKGMKFGISNHFAENRGWFPRSSAQDGYYDTNVTKNDPSGNQWLYSPTDMTDAEHAQRWLDIAKEIVDKYHPDMTYFDGGISNGIFNTVKRQFAAHYYNSAQTYNPDGVLFNYKGSAFTDGEAVLDIERGQLASIRSMPWQTDTSLSAKSWGYVEDDVYRNADYFIGSLVDIVSKNGCLLLNVGPKADGTIPEEAKKTLLDIGKWLKANGEAIYGTRPWITFGEGPTVPGSYYTDNKLAFTESDIRFTKNKDNSNLYITVLTKPSKNKVLVTTLKRGSWDAANVDKITLLDGGDELAYNQTDSGLEITLPEDWQSRLTRAFSMKVTFKNGLISPVSTDAFSTTEAESYYDGSNIEKVHCEADGSEAVHNTADGGYTKHVLNFGTSGATSLSASISPDSSGSVEIRLGSPEGRLLGTLNVTPGQGAYRSISCIIDAKDLRGDQDICFVYRGDIKLNNFIASYRALGRLIQAEDFDEKYGDNVTLSVCPDGTYNLGYMNTGYWVKYSNFDFGEGISKVIVRLATNTGPEPLCGIDFRIDSLDESNSIASTGAGFNTGGWETYKTVELDVTKNVTGTHDLYIYFFGPANVNWFYMHPSERALSKPWLSGASFDSYDLGNGNLGTYTVEFDITPFEDNIDGLVGYVGYSTAPSAWNSFAVTIRCNTSGYFDCRNGTKYVSSDIPYSKNITYHVKTIINTVSKTYSVFINEKGSSDIKTLYVNAAFRNDAPVMNDVGKVCVRGGYGAPSGQFLVENHVIKKSSKLEYTGRTMDGESQFFSFYAAQQCSPVFIMACYEESGKLDSAKIKTMSFSAETLEKVNFEHSKPGYVYKLFVWDSLDTAEPILSVIPVE